MTTINIREIAKDSKKELLNFLYAKFCEHCRKKCRVSLGAPYSSVIAALSQNESAELRTSFVKGSAGFPF